MQATPASPPCLAILLHFSPRSLLRQNWYKSSSKCQLLGLQDINYQLIRTGIPPAQQGKTWQISLLFYRILPRKGLSLLVFDTQSDQIANFSRYAPSSLFRFFFQKLVLLFPQADCETAPRLFFAGIHTLTFLRRMPYGDYFTNLNKLRSEWLRRLAIEMIWLGVARDSLQEMLRPCLRDNRTHRF